MIFKIAILQKRSMNGQIDKNVESIIIAMKEAAENNADILLLPECFITGYDLPMSYEKSIVDGDNSIIRICEIAREYQIGIVLTTFTKGVNHPQNTAVAMANPNGENAGCSCAYSPICWDKNGRCVDNTVLLADDVTEGIFYAELLDRTIREPFIRIGQ